MADKCKLWIMVMHVVLVLSKKGVNTQNAEVIEDIEKEISDLQRDLLNMKVSFSEHTINVSEFQKNLLKQTVDIEQQKTNISHLVNLIMERDLQECKFENQLLKLENNLRQHFEDRIHELYLKLEQANNSMNTLNSELGSWVLKTQQLDGMLNETSQTTKSITESQKRVEKTQEQIDLILKNVTRKLGSWVLKTQQLDDMLNETSQTTKNITESQKRFEKTQEQIDLILKNVTRELGSWVLKTQQLDDMLNETSQTTKNITESQKRFEKTQEQIDLILENVTRENAEQTRQLDILKHEKLNSTKSSNLAGATYIRWGRTTCLGNETELVYSGQAAGSHYDHPGGAVNHLCLPKNPEWGSFKMGTSHHAYIYGSKIATDGQNIPGSTVDRKYQGLDVFCAVCRSKTRTSSLMVPGRNVCDNGWNLEYNGYLMAGRYNHQAATEYICMDSEPETVSGEKGNTWKNIFYSVEAQCNPLRCPPYVNGMEMTCAVCTK